MTEVLDRAQAGGQWPRPHWMSRILSPEVLTCDATGRVLGGSRSDYATHLVTWGPRAEWFGSRGAMLREWIDEIGLTGRGGAHFPVARKWAPAISAGPGGTVVVNAAEGEPAAAKDAALLQLQPHLVLDGACAIAEMIAARDIVVWVHADALATLGSIESALAERVRAGVSGPPIRIMTAPHAYVSGEASAVIQGVRGGPALPMTVLDPARPWGEGPAVLVQNAETVARVAAVAATGPASYRPTSLVTIATATEGGRVTGRTVVEALPTEVLADVVGRTSDREPAAVLLGGFGGTWLDWADAAWLSLDPAALRSLGLSLGAGVVLLAPDRRSVASMAAGIADYLAGESAQQCGPCVFGLPALAKAAEDRGGKRIRALLPLVEGRGACRHPDGAVRMLRSAVDLDDHWREEARLVDERLDGERVHGGRRLGVFGRG